MKPRVFVSSTYYDLKHAREKIGKFIDNYYLKLSKNQSYFHGYKF